MDYLVQLGQKVVKNSDMYVQEKHWYGRRPPPECIAKLEWPDVTVGEQERVNDRDMQYRG